MLDWIDWAPGCLVGVGLGQSGNGFVRGWGEFFLEYEGGGMEREQEQEWMGDVGTGEGGATAEGRCEGGYWRVRPGGRDSPNWEA